MLTVGLVIIVLTKFFGDLFIVLIQNGYLDSSGHRLCFPIDIIKWNQFENIYKRQDSLRLDASFVNSKLFIFQSNVFFSCFYRVFPHLTIIMKQVKTQMTLLLVKMFILVFLQGCDSNFEVNIFSNCKSRYKWNNYESCLLNCWSLLLKISSAIQVYIV